MNEEQSARIVVYKFYVTNCFHFLSNLSVKNLDFFFFFFFFFKVSIPGILIFQ